MDSRYNSWIAVRVEDSVVGRTKLGAVPYAVEAGHAVSADSAITAATASAANAASGSLATSIAELAAKSECR